MEAEWEDVFARLGTLGGGGRTRQGGKVMAVLPPLPVDLQDRCAQLQQGKGGITEKLQPKYVLTSTREFM